MWQFNGAKCQKAKGKYFWGKKGSCEVGGEIMNGNG